VGGEVGPFVEISQRQKIPLDVTSSKNGRGKLRTARIMQSLSESAASWCADTAIADRVKSRRLTESRNQSLLRTGKNALKAMVESAHKA